MQQEERRPIGRHVDPNLLARDGHDTRSDEARHGRSRRGSGRALYPIAGTAGGLVMVVARDVVVQGDGGEEVCVAVAARDVSR